MLTVRACEDPEGCRRLWERIWPTECLFDLWPVRACFEEPFGRSLYFLVAEHKGVIRGMLALSWIEEERCFGHFPGETWNGKTWLEQNRIPASGPKVAAELLNHIPGPAHLRYLTRESLSRDEDLVGLDEVGYLFFPRQYDWSFDAYMQQFSAKSRKKLARELGSIETMGVSYRYDELSDMDHLYEMNRKSFGERSYFSDPRFLKSFENLVSWLHKNELLRITTVVVGGEIVAVDVGAVWNRSYTVLAGGARPDFSGVGKLINFHHIEWACRRRLEKVDFLCGDFGWKERFHLDPRPLYEIRIPSAPALLGSACFDDRPACAR